MARPHRPYKNLSTDELKIISSFSRDNSIYPQKLLPELKYRKKNIPKDKEDIQQLINITTRQSTPPNAPSSSLPLLGDTAQNEHALLSHHITALKIEATEQEQKNKRNTRGTSSSSPLASPKRAIKKKSDNDITTEKLIERYQHLRDGGYPYFNRSIFNQLNSGLKKDVAIKPLRICELRNELNDEQWRAVKQSNNEQIVAIWGPPGTGKTNVLSKIALNFFNQGKKILITSHTKLAVDHLLSKICHQLDKKNDTRLYRGQIQRLGEIQSVDLANKYKNCIVQHHVVNKIRLNLRDQIDFHQKCLQRLEEKRSPLIAKKKAYDEKDNLAQKRIANDQDHTKRVAFLEKQIPPIDQQIETIKTKLFIYKKFGRIICFIFRKKINRFKVRLTQAEHNKTMVEGPLNRMLMAQENLTARSKQDSAETDILRRIDLSITPSELKIKIKEIDDEISGLHVEIRSIQQKISDLESTVEQGVRVTATTAARAHLSYQANTRYDVVIVDEVSMLPLPLVSFVAGMADEHVVLGGDFRQLSPIITSNDPIVKHWMGRTIFDTLGVVESVEKNSQPSSWVMLKTQYRNIPDICHTYNTLFYNNMLKTATDADLLANKIYPRLFEENVVIIDTSTLLPAVGSGFADSDAKSSSGRSNVIHAAIIRFIFEHLLTAGNIIGQDIGVITPYSPQAELLQELLGSNKPDSISIGTVHKFQGSERNCIIFDITDGLGKKPSIFLQASTLAYEGARLLNVALSRAQGKLIIVVNCDYIEQSPQLNKSFIRQLISIVKCKKQVMDLIETPLSCHVAEQNSIITRQAIFFTDKRPHNNIFRNDLKNAKRSIKFFYPAILEQEDNYWDEFFVGKTSENIKISLVTTSIPETGQKGFATTKDRLKSYNTMGIDVKFQEHIPGKLCIIDEEILWHNTDNHLPPSREGMRIVRARVKSPMACKQLEKAFSNFDFSSKAPKNTTRKITKKKLPDTPATDNVENQKSSSCQKITTKDSAINSCPDCGKKLVVNMSKNGKFYGCEGFPGCLYQVNLR